MTQKFCKLLLLFSCSVSIFASDLSDIMDFTDETNSQEFVRKPFNSLQVAGPLAVTGLASLNALNVKNGADFGGDVAIDGNLYVDGGIVLDSCLVLTCTSAGTLLVNGVPITAGGGGSSCDTTDTYTALTALSSALNTGFASTFTMINTLGACMPMPVPSDGNIISSGYYCLTGDATNTISIGLSAPVSDVTLDLNNHTITPMSGDGIDVYAGCSRITIRNGSIVGGDTGIFLEGSSSDSDFYIHDINIDGVDTGIGTGGYPSLGVTNLTIARVVVTNGAGGFGIYASNVTLSACQANNSGGDGFNITGADGSSGILDSCIAADNSAPGFVITGTNVTLTNCTAQGNGGVAGFWIVSGTNIMLVNCTANFNAGYGFYSGAGGVSSFISCIAQDNSLAGFDMSGSTGSGLIKSCVADNNGTTSSSGCGFYDSTTSSLYQYVANTAQGNGTNPAGSVLPTTDSNYFLNFTPTPPNGAVAPFYQSPPNFHGALGTFTPAYWNNITLAN